MSPPALSEAEEQIIVRERLRLLAIGFYVKGAVGAVVVSFFLIHFFMMLGFSFLPQSAWDAQPKSVTTTQSSAVLSSPVAFTPADESGAAGNHVPNFRGGDRRNHFAGLDVWRVDDLRRTVRSQPHASHVHLGYGWLELRSDSVGDPPGNCHILCDAIARRNKGVWPSDRRCSLGGWRAPSVDVQLSQLCRERFIIERRSARSTSCATPLFAGGAEILPPL